MAGGHQCKEIACFFYRNSRNFEQLRIDNKARSWDHQYILDEVEENRAAKTKFYFDEVYIMRNASLQLRTGDGINRVLECNKIYGDATGRIYLQVLLVFITKGYVCNEYKR